MTSLKYDVRGVEPGQDFDEPIPKGVYRLTILSCILTKSSKGNDMLELELEIVKGKYKGRRVWDYVVLTKKSEWKLASLIAALGLKEKGSINPEKLQGKTLTAKVKLETYTTEDDDGEKVSKVTNKIGALLPKNDDSEEEDEEDEGEEEEEPETDDDDAEEEEDEDEDGDEEEDGEDEEYSWEEIQDSTKAELKEVIKDEELGIRVTKKTKLADLRDKVCEALELEEGADDEEQEDDDGDEELEYSEMSVAELKAELEERELKTSGKKPALIKRLEADDEEDGDEEDDDGDEPF